MTVADPRGVRVQRLSEMVADLVGALTRDYDLDELLHLLVERCVELFDGDAAGLIMESASGQLQVAATSSHESEVVELYQVQSQEGPCWEAVSTGEPVLADLAVEAARWPTWSQVAAAQGIRSVGAFPMTARGRTIGALNVFSRSSRPLDPEQRDAGRLLANVASVVVLSEYGRQQDVSVIAHLQTALQTRVVIEQAKGVLAERDGLSLGAAFEQLRRYARNNSLKIHDVAGRIVEGHLDAVPLAAQPPVRNPARPRPPRPRPPVGR